MIQTHAVTYIREFTGERERGSVTQTVASLKELRYQLEYRAMIRKDSGHCFSDRAKSGTTSVKRGLDLSVYENVLFEPEATVCDHTS